MFPAMLFLAASAAAAAPPTPVSQIWLGGVVLTIGMSKPDALKALSEFYKVAYPETDGWVVLAPTAALGRYKKVTSLSFKGGMLRQARKTWTMAGNAEANALVAALFSALDGRLPDEPSSEAGFEAKSILITDRLHRRRFELEVTINQGHSFSEVTDVIGDVPVFRVSVRELRSGSEKK